MNLQQEFWRATKVIIDLGVRPSSRCFGTYSGRGLGKGKRLSRKTWFAGQGAWEIERRWWAAEPSRGSLASGSAKRAAEIAHADKRKKATRFVGPTVVCSISINKAFSIRAPRTLGRFDEALRVSG